MEMLRKKGKKRLLSANVERFEEDETFTVFALNCINLERCFLLLRAELILLRTLLLRKTFSKLDGFSLM